MTDAQRATEAANKARAELRDLALKEDSTADQLAEANKKLGDLEARSAALSASEPVKIAPTEDAAACELRSLTGRTNAGRTPTTRS